MNRYGIDVGGRRIGVARAIDGLVVPVTTIYRDEWNNGVDDVVDIVDRYGDKEVEFFIGLPVLMNGQFSTQAQITVAWAQQLQRALPQATIRMVDERLTSRSAHAQLYASGRGSRHHKEVIDQQSAVIILQQALATQDGEKTTSGIALDSLVADEGRLR